MRAHSCFSSHLDPYRAGVEIAEQFGELRPEVIFLFCSIQYPDFQELLDAIYEDLAPCVPLIIGNSGYGVFSREGAADIGVSALAINSDGKVRWSLQHCSGIRGNPHDETQKCLLQVLSQCSASPRLLFLAADFRADSSRIIRALNEHTSIPVVGGLAGDDYAFRDCRVFANRLVLEDALVLLAMEGDIAFDIQLGNSPLPIGQPGTVTQVKGTQIHSVNRISVMDFIENEMGKPIDYIDKGIMAFTTISADKSQIPKIRSLLFPDDQEQERSLQVMGSVENGERIQLCIYPPERMLDDVSLVCKRSRSLPFQPVAALIISCAGRKMVLGEQIKDEVLQLQQFHPGIQALAGFPSFGEFAPVRLEQAYSPIAFHNMTYVQLLLGSPPP